MLSERSIRRFLQQFLSDKRVVPLSRLIWYPILFLIILPLRSKKLLAKYRIIWRSDGLHPLVYYTQQQAILLAQRVTKHTDEVIVDYAFCYGTHSIARQLSKNISSTKIDQLTVIPLYPQYSSTTTASVYDQVSKYFIGKTYIPSLKFCNSFASHPAYIDAIVNLIRKYWDSNGPSQYILFSFHSIPQTMIDNGDCYYEECKNSYLAISSQLTNLGVDTAMVFQSKFGKAKWLEPATDKEIVRLAQSGVRLIDVICPGFVSDCLETLEEVAISYRELFIKHGGQELRYIPCLNDNDDLIDVLTELSS